MLSAKKRIVVWRLKERIELSNSILGFMWATWRGLESLRVVLLLREKFEFPDSKLESVKAPTMVAAHSSTG